MFKCSLQWLNTNDKPMHNSGDSFLSWMQDKKQKIRKTQPMDGDERQMWEKRMDKWDLFTKWYFLDNLALLSGNRRDELWNAFQGNFINKPEILSKKDF